jgi:uncharacterized protein YbjT (DUF2867 family)
VTGASVSGPVVVTGATGFLGEHLCAELLRRGVAVRALARTVAQAYYESRERLGFPMLKSLPKAA